MSSKGEVRLDAVLEGGEPQLHEARDLGLGKRLVRELGQRFAAPEGERLPELGRRSRRLRFHEIPAFGRKPLEPPGVDSLVVDPEHVPRRLRREHATVFWVDSLAQPGNEVLQHLRRSGRALLAPELLDQAVARHDLVGVKREEGEQRPLPSAA